MSNSGRQHISQKVALNRSVLVINSTLSSFEHSENKFISAFAIQSKTVIAGLAKERNPSSNNFTRIINSARAGYHALQCIAERSKDGSLEKRVAINGIVLAEYFLSEFKSRLDRKPIDLVYMIKQPIEEAVRLALYNFDLGPVDPHKFTFKLGQIVELSGFDNIDGKRYRIKGINPLKDGEETLYLEIDSGQPDAASL